LVDPIKKLKAAGLGRFQVMALLQAARYHIFYGDLDKAKSFGLNRAIFYAWAKYHGPHTQRWRAARLEVLLRKPAKEKKGRCPEGYTDVLGECIQVGGRGFYKIGDQEQTPRDYDLQVTYKLKRLIDPEKAWDAALDYVKQFPKWVLKDPQRFYKLVYEPVRDIFLAELLEDKKPQPPPWIIEKLLALEEMYKKTKTTSLDEFM